MTKRHAYVRNRLTHTVMRVQVIVEGDKTPQPLYKMPQTSSPVEQYRLQDGGWDVLDDSAVLRWALEQYAETSHWETIGRTNRKLIKWIDGDAGNDLAVQVLNDLFPVVSSDTRLSV